MRQIVPESSERDVIRSSHLKGYAEVKTYIAKQVSIRRELKASGVVPMDLDMAREVFTTIIESDSEEAKEGRGRKRQALRRRIHECGNERAADICKGREMKGKGAEY